jgi:hypothetical protein
MCVGMSSLDHLSSLLGFNLAPGGIAVQKGKLPNVTDVLFACLLVGNLVDFHFLFTSP